MNKKRIRSAIPLYGAAAVWLLMGLIAPMYKLSMILLTLALSAAAFLVLTKRFPGREVEVETKPDSGDEAVNRQIEEGRATLKRIHESNAAIPDPGMTARIDRMEKAGAGIFDTLEKDPGKAAQVRRFMNYYLPTTDKLLTRYRQLSAVGAEGENISSAIKSIDNSMEMIAVAFEKQLDALYQDSALDIETDIDVLETMIRSDAGAKNDAPAAGIRLSK